MTFNLVPDSFMRDNCWLHESKPVWIVRYPATQIRAEHFQAYRAVARVPAGRQPWSVDNRRIGTDRGFPTFDEAARAAEELIAEEA